MSFEAIYTCDQCGKKAPAEWSGQPHWEVPEGWVERAGPEKHWDLCEICKQPHAPDCDVTECMPNCPQYETRMKPHDHSRWMEPPQDKVAQVKQAIEHAVSKIVFEAPEKQMPQGIARLLRVLADHVEGERVVGFRDLTWEAGSATLTGIMQAVPMAAGFIKLEVEWPKEGPR